MSSREPRHTPNPTFPLRETLRSMANAGMSFTQAAKRMDELLPQVGPWTKGRVAGHARRLGVTFHNRGTPASSAATAEKVETHVPLPTTDPPAKPPLEKRPLAKIVTPNRSISVIQARDYGKRPLPKYPTCCWHGCRAPTISGKPYCREHRGRS